MDERVKIESILKRIETLREEVASLLPKPEPVVAPESEPVVVVKSQPIVRVSLPKAPMPSPEPDAFERFINRVGDWFAVRGDFAPQGMTREFAVATRWLTRLVAGWRVDGVAFSPLHRFSSSSMSRLKAVGLADCTCRR